MTEGLCSYRDLDKDLQLIELEKSSKNVIPMSSDGMVMRTSYFLRFDLTKNEIFKRKKDKRALKESDLKLARKENTRLNNSKAYVEFPIEITYPDSKETFISPMDRQIT